ncbi:MAG: gamma-glutamyl-gamma-aminobutyrate hydrolase family protein [Candidatus Velthaea sp.]
MKPKIGITAESGKTSKAYAGALAACGAKTVVFPNDAARIDAALDSVTGILLTGGLDVDPALYGQPAHPTTETVSRERDAFERALVRRARERDMPTLAICRGVQIANVAFGGNLIQHVPDAFGNRIPHQVVPKNTKVVDDHVVDVAPDTLLAQIVKRARFATNSRHHQALGALASDLRAVARTADDVVEAVEARFPARFWLGVQWHPESTLDHDGGESRAIFEAFVVAAARTP